MNIIKHILTFIGHTILTLLMFRRKHISPINRRFCFILVSFIASASAMYISKLDTFSTSSLALTITLAITIYFAISLRVFLLTMILTCCLSMPGIYYMQTNSLETKAKLSVVNAYGTMVQGTFDITTNLSSDALEGLAHSFGDASIKNVFLNADNEIKEIKLSGQNSSTYAYSSILDKNLILLLVILSIFLAAITSYICVVYSHYEHVIRLRHIEKIRKDNAENEQN